MADRIRITPAILTDSPDKLAEMVSRASGFAGWLQVDIMDGRFVPSRSISCKQVKEAGIAVSWEVHLMVERPEKYIECFKEAGAKRIIFHYEAADSPETIIRSIKKLGLEAGLAINPETKTKDIISLLLEIDSILLLSVEPGYYGSPFIPEVLDKVKEIRDIRPELEIGIDGGIKETNIAEVAASGVDSICVGSAIFLSKEPAESYKRLKTIAEDALK